MKVGHLRKGALLRVAPRQRVWRALAFFMIAALGSSTYWLLKQHRYDSHLDVPKARAVPDRNPSPSPSVAVDEIPARDGTVRRVSNRAVYPYSIIPGGIASVPELESAIVNDPVIFVHYSSFHLERARIIRLDRDRFVHVSYRVGDRIYWTKRELKLEKGEELVTDGVQTARVKCGNLISENVEAPVSPHEPTESEFNAPVGTTYAPGDTVSDNRFPEPEPPGALPPPSYSPPPTSSSWLGGEPGPGGPGSFFVPPPAPIPHPRKYQPPTEPVPPPVINAPEPGTDIQLLLAVLAIVWLRKRTGERRA